MEEGNLAFQDWLGLSIKTVLKKMMTLKLIGFIFGRAFTTMSLRAHGFK